jgi:hypothetical protein
MIIVMRKLQDEEFGIENEPVTVASETSIVALRDRLAQTLSRIECKLTRAARKQALSTAPQAK